MNQNQFKIRKHPDSASFSLHTRVAPFFKFFTSAVNLTTYFLVTHQNFITLFDLKVTDTANMICTNREVEDEIKGVVQVKMTKDTRKKWVFEDCFVTAKKGK